MKKAASIFLTALTLIACCRNVSPEVTSVSLDEGVPDVNCYTAVLPPDGAVDAYLILLPGFGESADSALEASGLPWAAARERIAVFIPTLN